jgi:hypothetical protein
MTITNISLVKPGITGSYKFWLDQPETYCIYKFLYCSAIVGFFLKLHDQQFKIHGTAGMHNFPDL